MTPPPRVARGLSLESASSAHGPTGAYVDVHTHLIHPEFEGREDGVARRAYEAGLRHVVVNGLDPPSNRRVLELCDRHAHLHAALGIYPLDAACNTIAANPGVWSAEFPPPEVFDVEEEVAFIDAAAGEGRIVAVGECGLDGFYVKDAATMAEQERVLEMLIGVALKHDLPLILHTRKVRSG